MLRSTVGKVMWMRRARFLTFALVLVVTVLAAGVLALVATKPAEAAFPGTNGKIAFSSNRLTPGNPVPPGRTIPDEEIFAINPDRTGLVQLTDNTAWDTAPAWSYDGNWMAYTGYQDHGNGEIYMRTDGYFDPVSGFFVLGGTIRLTTNTLSEGSPAFNHDTSKIAWASFRDGDTEIYVMDTSDSNNDGNGDNLTNLTNNTATDGSPDFSPDGTKIAFTSNQDGNHEVWVMDSDGTDPLNLTNNTAGGSSPDFSPDGTKIAFSRDVNPDPGVTNAEIFVMNADGTDQKRLTKNAAFDSSPAWSPDGKKIAFESFRGGDYEIFVMKPRPEGSKNRPKNLTRNDVIDVSPDWRPIVQP